MKIKIIVNEPDPNVQTKHVEIWECDEALGKKIVEFKCLVRLTLFMKQHENEYLYTNLMQHNNEPVDFTLDFSANMKYLYEHKFLLAFFNENIREEYYNMTPELNFSSAA